MITRLRLVIILFCLAYVSFSQNYTSRLFSTDEGLPDTYIYSVVQDDKGFLWLATGKGLVKFDGQIFTSYDLHAEDSDDIVYSGALDKNNDLWFGTFSGKIYKFDTVKNKLYLYPQQAKGSVNKIIPSKNNALYFLSKGNGVYALKKSKLQQIQNTENYQVNALEGINEDLLLAGTSEGLITVNGATGEITELTGFSTDIIQVQKLKKKEHTYMIATLNGVFQITLNNTFTGILKQTELTKDFKTAEISAAYLNEADQNLYFGTKDEKFSILNLEKQKIKTIDENDYLAIANSIFVDRESNIWITTTGKGLYRLFKTDFDFIPINAPVFAITQDGEKNTYYGTKSGVLVTNTKGNLVKTINKAGNKELGKINALFFDGTNLWIGTDSKGLVVIDPKTMAPIKLEFSPIENISVNSIISNPYDSDIQVNTNLEGVYTYNSYKLLYHFSVQNSLLHNNIYSSLKSKTGRVYYATHNTSFNFSVNDQIFEIDTKSNGFISDFNTFAEDPAGNIMIGTNGDGIYVLSDTTIKPFAFNEQLESKFCNGLVFDNDHNLFIMQRYSLYTYYAHEKILKKNHLNFSNKILFNPNAVYKNKSGDLFFGTDKNVIIYEGKKQAGSSNYLPESYILRVQLFDSVITLNNAATFKHGSYNFTFGYSALCLKNSEDVTFKYMLEGRDNNWSEPTKLQRVEFSNLTDGTYTFKVLAINSNGFQEQEPATVTFTIERPFWKNPVFWITIIILLIILFFFILKVRTAALIKAKLRLEGLVDEKTKQLREEKEIVELNNKIIAEQHEDITASITYAKRIQDALLPDKQVIKDKSNDLFIFYQPRDIVSGDFYWLGEINGLKYIVAGDCTGHGVPGGFMTMIGNTLLNKIILERKITQPKEILQELDKEVRKSLKQYTADATRDGMDLALCCIDTENRKLIYAGALRPLYGVRKKELTDYEPTKSPIGGFNYDHERVYKETEIAADKNDMFYMFSDGYADQFGGAKGKKFMLKNFKTLLVSVSELPLTEQEEALRTVYNSWKGSLDQVDDALVIGIRM